MNAAGERCREREGPLGLSLRQFVAWGAPIPDGEVDAIFQPSPGLAVQDVGEEVFELGLEVGCTVCPAARICHLRSILPYMGTVNLAEAAPRA